MSGPMFSVVAVVGGRGQVDEAASDIINESFYLPQQQQQQQWASSKSQAP